MIKKIPVYVDPLQTSPGGGKAGATFRAGKKFSHLMAADLSVDAIEALHDMAARIGLRREWFQPASWPHYDVTVSKRALAVAAGAVQESHADAAFRRAKVRLAAKGDGVEVRTP